MQITNEYMNYLEQNEKTGRVILPDLARAFALFGIAVVNVILLAYPMGDYMSSGAASQPADKFAAIGIYGFFTAKSYTLFSFMFGVGFAYQMASADRKGVSFNDRYWRRIGGLIFFGFMHILLLFHGDILVVYAVLGSLLYLFRNKTPKSLNRWAFWIYMIQLILIGLMALGVWAMNSFMPEEDVTALMTGMQEYMAPSAEIYRSGSFPKVAFQRLVDWAMMTGGLFMQGAGVFAFFLLGLSAVKSGIINDPAHSLWKKYRRIYLPIGLLGSLYAGWLISRGDNLFSSEMWIGMFLIFLFAPFSTAGYLGLIAKFSQGTIGPIKAFLARGGTSSLTAYLMQGLIFSLIFNGYGLGYMGKLSLSTVFLIAAVTAVFTITFASLWRTKYERGPLETLLRNWTYAKDKKIET